MAEAQNAVVQYFTEFARHALAGRVPMLAKDATESAERFAEACVEAEALESLSEGMSASDEQEFRSVARYEWRAWKLRQRRLTQQDLAERLHRPGRVFVS